MSPPVKRPPSARTGSRDAAPKPSAKLSGSSLGTDGGARAQSHLPALLDPLPKQKPADPDSWNRSLALISNCPETYADPWKSPETLYRSEEGEMRFRETYPRYAQLRKLGSIPCHLTNNERLFADDYDIWRPYWIDVCAWNKMGIHAQGANAGGRIGIYSANYNTRWKGERQPYVAIVRAQPGTYVDVKGLEDAHLAYKRQQR